MTCNGQDQPPGLKWIKTAPNRPVALVRPIICINIWTESKDTHFTPVFCWQRSSINHLIWGLVWYQAHNVSQLQTVFAPTPGHLIGPEWSRDPDTGLWLALTTPGHRGADLASEYSQPPLIVSQILTLFSLIITCHPWPHCPRLADNAPRVQSSQYYWASNQPGTCTSSNSRISMKFKQINERSWF